MLPRAIVIAVTEGGPRAERSGVARSVFGTRKVLALAPLGFAAGMPVALTGGTLEAWLASDSVDVKTVGLMSLVGLPYAFKFLWAPLLDRVDVGWLGRRRGWIAVSQLAIVFVLAIMGALDVGADPGVVAAIGVLLAFLSANHIAAIDAYRTDVLAAGERGAGAASYLIGFRAGGAAAGGLALIAASYLSFAAVYWMLAGLLAVALLASAWAPPPPPAQRPPTSMREAMVEPFREYLTRAGAWVALLLVVTYRLGEALAGAMITPMLLAHGYGLVAVGVFNKAVALAAAVAGGLVGGVVVARWYLRPAMLTFGALAALGNLGYAILAMTERTHVGLATVVAIDNFCGGMAMTAFVAWLMALCSRSFSATQYALLFGIYTGVVKLCASLSGYLVAWLDWPAFFAVTVAASVPGLVLLARLPARVAMPESAPDPQ